MSATTSDYPLRFDVDYPERLNRWTTAFRPFWLLPVIVVLAVTSQSASFSGSFFFGPFLMILFRRKYPRWWFDWNRELLRFGSRVGASLMLLTDAYPSTDEQQSVRLDLDYPDVRNDLNRWLPLVKWLLAIPHYVVLLFLGIAAALVVVFAWFAILFTGRYPRGAFDFVVGVQRWSQRVLAYAYLLVTDRYPPFSLDGPSRMADADRPGNEPPEAAPPPVAPAP
jgi:hypothetical protein